MNVDESLNDVELNGFLTSNKWIGAVDDFWRVAGNWSTGIVPGFGDNVIIDDTVDPTTLTVFIDGLTTGEADTLTSSKAIDMSGGTLTIAGIASITGGLTVSGGTASFGDDVALSTLTLAGGDVDLNGTTNSIGALSLNAGTLTNPNALALSGSSSFTGGLLMGAGSLSNSSTLDLSGNTTIALGGALDNRGVLDLMGDVDVSAGCLSNSGTFRKTGGSTASDIAGAFTNTGSVSVSSGTLNFQTSYTQNAGLTNVNGGTLEVSGGSLILAGGVLKGDNGTIDATVNNTFGVVAPGASPGTTTITGNFTQGPGGTLTVELGGLAQGVNPGYDLLDVGGTATLDGTLKVVLSGGFVGAPGNPFDIITATSVANDFTTAIFPATHTFSNTNLGGLYQLLLLGLSLGEPVTVESILGSDEVVVLEQNLTALITQFAISEQEEALQKALPTVKCK